MSEQSEARDRVTVEGDRIVIDGPWSGATHHYWGFGLNAPRSMRASEVGKLLRAALSQPSPQRPQGPCPIRIERDARDHRYYPHTLLLNGEEFRALNATQADALQPLVDMWGAESQPLPEHVIEGVVYDVGGGTVSVLVDRDTKRYPEYGARVSLSVRPPAQPKTVKVPLHELRGRRLPNEPRPIDRLFATAHGWTVDCHRGDDESLPANYRSHPIVVDSDGMVEVLPEGDEG